MSRNWINWEHKIWSNDPEYLPTVNIKKIHGHMQLAKQLEKLPQHLIGITRKDLLLILEDKKHPDYQLVQWVRKIVRNHIEIFKLLKENSNIMDICCLILLRNIDVSDSVVFSLLYRCFDAQEWEEVLYYLWKPKQLFLGHPIFSQTNLDRVESMYE